MYLKTVLQNYIFADGVVEPNNIAVKYYKKQVKSHPIPVVFWQVKTMFISILIFNKAVLSKTNKMILIIRIQKKLKNLTTINDILKIIISDRLIKNI